MCTVVTTDNCACGSTALTLPRRHSRALRDFTACQVEHYFKHLTSETRAVGSRSDDLFRYCETEGGGAEGESVCRLLCSVCVHCAERE